MSVLAKIKLMEEQDKDFTGKFINGFRCTIEYMEGENWECLVELNSEAFPGDEVEACISFLSPEEHLNKIKNGMTFKINVAIYKVGYGKFLSSF